MRTNKSTFSIQQGCWSAFLLLGKAAGLEVGRFYLFVYDPRFLILKIK